MITYKEFEERVFNWLMAKHQADSGFTFSLRKRAAEGAELDYFIGTENSNYFATTFWSIPVAYPSATGDLINIAFSFTDTGYEYKFHFKQTKNPSTDQNRYALELIRNIRSKIGSTFNNMKIIRPESEMEYYIIPGQKDNYNTVEELIVDAEKDLNKLFPIVDTEIARMKIQHPNFVSQRISLNDFNLFLEKFEERKKKYSNKLIANTHANSKKLIVSDLDGSVNSNDHPLNLILFGPPGTGKTFNSINKAISIIEPEFNLNTHRYFVKDKFDELVKSNQIVFTTFHQSMSYEDFIEGIKPIENNGKISYETQPGIFLKLCKRASSKETKSFNDAYEKLIKKIEEEKTEYLKLETKTNKPFWVSANSNGNLSVYTTENKNYQGSMTKEKLERFANGENTFLGWEGYANSVIAFLKSKCGLSEKSEDNTEKKFVIIIDEINRGNVSQIFGELITLIEEDKRMGKSEALEITLPYSKEKMCIPPNLYIVGTMNTADRSVEALDTALRRRFAFEEMPPNSKLLESKYSMLRLWEKYRKLEWGDKEWEDAESELLDLLGGEILDYNKYQSFESVYIDKNVPVDLSEVIDFNGLKLDELLNTINWRLEKLIDKDHKIGHSYFISVFSWNDLKSVFYNKIIPLLQEYFYGDLKKLGLVLGKGFVGIDQNNSSKEIAFADFEYDGANDYENRDIVKIIDYRNQATTYKLKIKVAEGNKEIVMNFESAIKVLLNQDVE